LQKIIAPMKENHNIVTHFSDDNRTITISCATSPKEGFRILPSKADSVYTDTEEKEKVLKAAYLLRLIDEPVPENTPKWADYRDEKKAEGIDPDPVEFLKKHYKEWYKEGVLYPNIVRDYDQPLYDALAYYTRSIYNASPTEEVDIFPITKQGLQAKRSELVGELLGVSPQEARRFGYNLHERARQR